MPRLRVGRAGGRAWAGVRSAATTLEFTEDLRHESIVAFVASWGAIWDGLGRGRGNRVRETRGDNRRGVERSRVTQTL